MTYLDVTELEVTPTDWIPENSIIKVIGVGGGGCNAVNYMYNRRIATAFGSNRVPKISSVGRCSC